MMFKEELETHDTDYKSIKDFLNAAVSNVYEDGRYYYVHVKPFEMYSNSIWKTDKKTGAVSYMMFTQFLGFKNKTTEIDPLEFKRMVQEKY